MLGNNKNVRICWLYDCTPWERTSYYPNRNTLHHLFSGKLNFCFFLTLLLVVWHLTWCIYLYVYIFRSRQPVCMVIGFDVLRKGLPYVYDF